MTGFEGVRARIATSVAFAAICSMPLAGIGTAATSALPVAERSTAARTVMEAEIARIARSSGGRVGVFARHLESGRILAMNDSEPFPMASTFKVAVAGAILAQVDLGHLSLDQMIPVDPKLVLSSEGIAETFPFPGVSASVHNLIESMLTRSDNTATNVLTRLAGGPGAVTAWVKGVGVEGLRVDGDTNDIVGRYYGLTSTTESVEEQINKAVAANPALAAQEDKPNPVFDDDVRDTATPKAMTLLLSKILEGHVLSASSTDVLLGAMSRCITGLKRLRGLLPPDTQVRDKTGTIGGTVNDVGIITLPEGHGRVVIAVYIKKSTQPVEARERVIAQVARSVYDYMLLESVQH